LLPKPRRRLNAAVVDPDESKTPWNVSANRIGPTRSRRDRGHGGRLHNGRSHHHWLASTAECTRGRHARRRTQGQEISDSSVEFETTQVFVVNMSENVAPERAGRPFPEVGGQDAAQISRRRRPGGTYKHRRHLDDLGVHKNDARSAKECKSSPAPPHRHAEESVSPMPPCPQSAGKSGRRKRLSRTVRRRRQRPVPQSSSGRPSKAISFRGNGTQTSAQIGDPSGLPWHYYGRAVDHRTEVIRQNRHSLTKSLMEGCGRGQWFFPSWPSWAGVPSSGSTSTRA